MRRPFATAFVLVLTLLGGSGCGARTADQSTPELDEAAVARMVNAYEDVQADAQSLLSRFRGTQEQRAAAEFLINYDLNHPTAACMQAKGFEWEPPELQVQAPLPFEPFGDTVWLREPMRRIASERVQATAPFSQAEQAGRSHKLSPDADKALVECLETNESNVPSDDDLDYAFDENIAMLAASFYMIAEDVDADLGSPSDYQSCMSGTVGIRAEQWPAGSPGYLGVAERLIRTSAPPLADIPTDGSKGAWGWESFLADEDAALMMDASCRTGRYEKGMEPSRRWSTTSLSATVTGWSAQTSTGDWSRNALTAWVSEVLVCPSITLRRSREGDHECAEPVEVRHPRRAGDYELVFERIGGTEPF